ncbi:maleylpyruvate isomerase family mycothiol-dependent enzyme [Trujillonella humicola]|uniref:maleylpyruvate isomerase family mycothiol-dependent enzyme n=1 Tax=Trujillonella humicola TaxID=3383699 RepID=UPI003905FB45
MVAEAEGGSDLLGALRVETDRVAGLLAGGEPDAAVPACPGWTLRHLGEHLAAVHRWGAAAVRAGGERVAMADPELVGDVADHYAAAAGDLLEALGGTRPDAQAWGFGPPPRTAGFWARRQLHETTVHRWDVQQALRRPVDAVPAVQAADGIDEVLTVFVSRRLRSGPPLPVSIRLRAVEGGDWRIGDGEPAAAVTGPAQQLFLLLWGRVDPTAPGVRIAGDQQAAVRVLEAGLTP